MRTYKEHLNSQWKMRFEIKRELEIEPWKKHLNSRLKEIVKLEFEVKLKVDILKKVYNLKLKGKLTSEIKRNITTRIHNNINIRN